MSKQKDNDEFGQRMKAYEQLETGRRLNPELPIYARLDGRAFSTFTKNFVKPFDEIISDAMIETTEYLVQETNARIGYTQSDEISLVWLPETHEEMLFNSKTQKLCSILAAMTTAKFIDAIIVRMSHRLPHFDCRVFNLPSKMEAANTILWRAMDARKNAILATAQAYFPSKILHGKDQTELLEMLKGIFIDMEDKYSYPDSFRYGTFIQKRNITRMLTEHELSKIPEENRPTTPVTKSEYRTIPMPPFNTVTNRIEVIFDAQEPQTG